MFHWITGTPFEGQGFSQQGDYDGLTLWEQMDNGMQYSPAKKYLTAVPILLYVSSAPA